MTASLHIHLRAAALSDRFTMHYFRVGGSLSKSLSGTAVDEIIKIGGWKKQQVARYYIGATARAPAGASKRKRVGASKQKRDSACATAIDLPLSPTFQEEFAVCTSRNAVRTSRNA